MVKELKLALAHERYKRDSIKTELGAELQAKTRELIELRSTLQGAGLKSTAQEIEEALASMEYQAEVRAEWRLFSLSQMSVEFY